MLLDLLQRVLEALRHLPEPLKKVLRPLEPRLLRKRTAELSYWKRRHVAEGGAFGNAHYRARMLAMAEEPNEQFLSGKRVADFGCGPRGSLSWASSASLRIGIDVLADRYVDEFPEDTLDHGMVYLTSTERWIPLPAEFVDIVFSLNALDHVNAFETMCREILRILKPGGLFVGSFNLGERPTAAEPQELTEERVAAALLTSMRPVSYRVSNRGPENDVYRPLMEGDLEYDPEKPGFLWVKAEKP